MRACKNIGLLVLVAAILLPSCRVYSSLHGVPESARGKLDPTLLGEWFGNEGDKRQYVSVAGDGVYEAYAVWDDKQGQREIKLSFEVVEYRDQTILDVTLAKSELELLGVKYGALIAPLHVFVRLERIGEKLGISWLTHDWITSFGKLTKLRSLGSNNSLWTFDSEQVLEALAQAASDANAWDQVLELRREKPSVEAADQPALSASAGGFEMPFPGLGPDLTIRRGEEVHVASSQDGYFWADVTTSADNRSVFAVRNRGNLNGADFDAIVRIDVPSEGALAESVSTEVLDVARFKQLLPGWTNAELDAVSPNGDRLLLRLGFARKNQNQGESRVFDYMPFLYDLSSGKLEAVLP